MYERRQGYENVHTPVFLSLNMLESCGEKQTKEHNEMKFSEMTYVRPDLDTVKKELTEITKRLVEATTYEEARAAFLEKETCDKHVQTAATLAQIRHTIDTRDKFYDEEQNFWNEAEPKLQEYDQKWTQAMLEGKFRKEFEEEYGNLMFVNAEIQLKTFSPEIIPQLQKENELKTAYEKLLASAQIPFEGNTYTLSQITPYKNDPDDARRLAAWKAEGQWYKDNQEQLDSLYDELVHVRDTMGRKLGYDGYTELGYYRMGRNCYTKEDVEKFRQAVVKYLVPVADQICRENAKRLGKEYPMSFADNALEFRSGNPKPFGTPDEILAHGKKFYDELSPETSEFFNRMLQDELMDVLSTDGKSGGGYCTSLPDYEMPFIFANFNGTQHDVEVITHEAGHAFAAYMNRDRIPMAYVWPGMEACEVHSMSMEFFAWPWAEGFFGKDTRKFYYSHLSSALTFIPYGTMVDHFQHIVFEKPDMTPKERHGVWKELLGIYMPWMKLDGEIPFYSEGEGWQRQHHIYSSPFYYIDYCLAQTVSLQFWAMIQEDPKNAWEHYMAYTKQGGSRVFTELLANAGLESPFEEACLRKVCSTAKKWLEDFDLKGIA
jgi:M3 family oligoendopeptidase